jgi:3',5'-cyclic AMP phosphodiesterase CpdA
MPAGSVSIVPGNHDRYTRGAARTARFERWFAAYNQTDRSLDDAIDGSYPFVRLCGPLAIIGLDSAVPRAPFVAAGEVGAAQRDRLAKVLLHPEVASRTAIIALHHPPWRLHTRHWLNGLRDWQALQETLRMHRPGMVLHGHLHRRVVSELVNAKGTWLVVGATSASLHHRDANRVAGYNEYVFDDRGELLSMRARVLDTISDAFETRELRRDGSS